MYLFFHRYHKILNILALYICALLAVDFNAVSVLAAGTYGYELIPKSLLKNADVVVRYHQKKVLIVSLSEVYVTERYVYTILNKEGYDHAKLNVFYDQFTKVENISGTLYSKDGKELKRLKKSDITDHAAFDGVSVFNDDRVKVGDFHYADYPFTVEFETEIRQNYTVFLPSWYPQPEAKFSVEKSIFQLEYPSVLPLRNRSFHLNTKPDEIIEGNVKKLNISIESLAAEKDDELKVIENFPRPSVIFAVDTFSFGGRGGKMDNWQSFGRFFYELNDKRQDLPEDIRRKVHQITDSCTSSFSKISVLYKYLQANERYVSIQLGIGGWQCFPAEYVAKNGFGDCKALSNYMMALLREAGILSDVVLVYGGYDKRRKILKDFTHNAFNHVILLVPMPKDTVWLECTSQVLPAGYLSNFTADRDVLLITPDGGHIVKTPVYNYADNIAISVADIRIDDNGVANARIRRNIKAALQDEERTDVMDRPKEEIENYLNNIFSLRAYKVNSYKIDTSLSGRLPVISEDINLSGTAKINRTGKRVFLEPDILPISIYYPNSSEERTTPFYINASYEKIDSEVVHIDGSYIAEFIPDEVNLKFPFAEYYCKIVFENSNTVKLTRQYIQKEGTYPANLFKDYVVLSKAVNFNSDQKQVVLVKKE